MKLIKLLLSAFLSLTYLFILAQDNHNEWLVHKDYEAYIVNNSTKLLILFPGGGQTARETKEEFLIIEPALENGVSLLLMNFNRKLWIEEDHCILIENQIEAALEFNEMNPTNIYYGGMSMGGNVALALADYLIEKKSINAPKGVFIVDSPLDLYGLYESATHDIENKEFSEERLAEPQWIIKYFEEEFRGKDSLLTNIQEVSPVTMKTNNIENIKYLQKIKLNLYTEPDNQWWMENRQTSFEFTNAYAIQNLAKLLDEKGWGKVNLIETVNKGYRANGDRHPHSWSIVDIEDLIKWMND